METGMCCRKVMRLSHCGIMLIFQTRYKIFLGNFVLYHSNFWQNSKEFTNSFDIDFKIFCRSIYTITVMVFQSIYPQANQSFQGLKCNSQWSSRNTIMFLLLPLFRTRRCFQVRLLNCAVYSSMHCLSAVLSLIQDSLLS